MKNIGMDARPIRPARPADAAFGAEMILSTMGRLGEALLGGGDRGRALDVLRAFFVRDENRFSHRWAWIIEREGEPAGIVLGYPWELERQLSLGTGKQAWSIGGASLLLHLAWHSLPLAGVEEGGPGAFIIAHLAVQPAHRRAGLARALLEHVERLGLDAGCHMCTLLVEEDNIPARRLYARVGYDVAQRYDVPLLRRRGMSAGFLRMEKHFTHHITDQG